MNPIQILAVVALGGTLLAGCNPKDPADNATVTPATPADATTAARINLVRMIDFIRL